jgi:hypothetical protein
MNGHTHYNSLQLPYPFMIPIAKPITRGIQLIYCIENEWLHPFALINCYLPILGLQVYFLALVAYT